LLDISHKNRTLRVAKAQSVVRMSPETLEKVRNNKVPKGDALQVARVAAILAAKDTSRIIPFCHPLQVEYAGVDFDLGENSITVVTTVKAIDKTGVEMEALTAAGVAALTLYDMLKMLDESLEISSIRLLSKQGGKSDFQNVFASQPRAAVLVFSDRVAAGEKRDRSGELIKKTLRQHELLVEDFRVIPDDADAAASVLAAYADELDLDFVFTCGGTGLGNRDVAPEATKAVIEREAPGIAEAIRAYGRERTPYAILSRAVAGLRGNTLYINLPGSVHAAADAMQAVFPAVLHYLAARRGEGHIETYGSGETNSVD
jgi:molybdenum cofactor biosynthesis protein MoaC